MIILLMLLPALVSGAREQIDWTKCAKRTKCFCGDASDPHKLVQRVDDGQGCEKVGAQSQYFTDSYALFQMQLTVDPNDPVLSGPENPRIMLMYGSKKLFGCEYNKADGKVILSGDKKEIFGYRIKLFEEKFEDRSYSEAGNVVCAVTVGRYSKFIKDIIEAQTRLSTLSKTTIMLTAGDSEANSKVYETPLPEDRLFVTLGNIKCNPAFKDMLYSSEYYVEPIRNKDRFKLNCDNYGTSYTMRYEKAGDKGEMKQLHCTEKTPSVYSYSIDTGKKNVAGEDIVIDVPDPESYSIFCSTPFEELCENPNACTKADDPNCPDYVPGSMGKSAKLTCPDKKWKINDEFYELKDQPACKRNTVLKANGASFIAVLSSGQSVPITKELKARCFTDWDCKKKSYLSIPSSGKVIIDNGIMMCNDTNAFMTVFHNETNTTLTAAERYKCDPAKGVFFNEANETETVPTNSRVSCRLNKTNFVKKVATITNTHVIMYIGAGAAVILLVVVGAVVGGFCCWKHRNDVDISNLKNMKKDALAEKCKKDFRHLLKATPSNAHLIVDGLTMIDKMLEVEVDDPKAWEEARRFLTRLHGSILRKDYHTWHLLSRYCHIQAKKIIDKHGWRTDTPITKANPKGIIRCVAIQLLVFCLGDHKNFDAEEYIEIGAGKLVFLGASQYPHAGVMWSLVPHTRRGKYIRFAKPPHFVSGFIMEYFCEVMRKVACKKLKIAIPDQDVIPDFGTVAAQAAYALGGIPRHTYLVKHTNGVLFGNEKMPAVCEPTAYIRGMCESHGHDPAPIVLESCKMWPNFNKDFLAEMNLLAPEPVWHAVWRDAFQLLSYYGRDLDILRIHSRFMPKDKSTDFFEMEREQTNFDKALDAALEDVRKWFTKRTDRDDLKQKKTKTAVNPKVKLTDRLFSHPPVGGCSSSDKSAAGSPAPTAAGAAGAAVATAPVAAPAAGAAVAADAAPAAAAAAVPTAPIAPTPTA